MSQQKMFNPLTFASMARDGTPAIGIDLGTTFSCVAVYRYGAPEIIPNDQTNRITPSCVSFDDHQRLIGDAARNQASMNPTNTVFDAKRLIGRTYNDPCVQSDVKLWPFRVTSGPNEKPTIVVRHRNEEKRFVAEEISAMVLTKMKECAEAFLGCHVSRAVVTVPNYFNDSQRQATKDAATIAGLDVLQILNEPTAVAVLCGIQNKRRGRGGTRKALIFDLGGGTFDVSLVEMDESGRIEVIATDGDTHLGGEDFDNRMVYHFMEVFRRNNNGANLVEDPKSMRRLRTACESAKRILSSPEGKLTTMQVNALYKGIDLNERISRAKFEDLNRDLFHKCMEIVRRLLTEARVEKRSIQDVVLVGGSSRIPRIEVMLRELFPMSEIRKSMNPDEAVAMGAAIRAAHLSGQYLQDTELLKNVTPLSLGLNVRGGLTYVLIPRNTQVPCEKKHTFATSLDFQTQVRFRVYEGERAESELNNLLGEFYVNVSRARKGVVKLDVVFSVDEDGILTVSSEEVGVGRKVDVKITNESGRLKSEEIERMVNDARNFKSQDEERRRAAVAMNELEEYVSEIEAKIRDSSAVFSKLTVAERRSLTSTIEQTRQWCDACVCAAAKPYQIEDKKNSMTKVWEPVRTRLREEGVFP